MHRVPGFLCPVVRRLHSDNEVREFPDRLGAELGIHLLDGLLEAAVHTISDDIKESQHPDLGMVDDFLLFLQEGIGPGGSRVHNRCHSCRKRNVRRDAQGGGVRACLRRKPVKGSSPVAHMEVNIDKAGSYVQAGYIDHFLRLACRNALGNCRYLPR